MSRITRFAARDPGPAARMAGFMAHLRDNGLRLGVAETETTLAALTHVTACDPAEARLALKAVCAGSSEEAARFDDLFDSYWRNGGRVRQRVMPSGRKSAPSRNSLDPSAAQGGGHGEIHSPEDGRGDGASAASGEGRLIASGVENLMRRDLRQLVSPQDIARAEAVARRLARAFRDRRSRRHRAAAKGDRLHFRKLIRQSLSTGGEPLRLPRKQRPDRPVKLVALCDVSGSMTVYARVFLAFLSGLMRADDSTDAWLFHTRLVRISDALRDPDPLRALNRLSLLSDGFGGGTRIGTALDRFARGPARRGVDGRSVVIILSDGYDTDPADLIGQALARLKKRGCKVVWLNPLKGWKDYAPVARGMASALPHLDLFAAATTLGDLAALEHRLEHLR